MPTPTPAERARTLVASARVATLTTFAPCQTSSTIVSISADGDGCPHVTLAANSPAVQQLRVRPLATVTVAPDGHGPLAVHGGARRIPSAEGTAVFRIEVGAVRLLDGTGAIDPSSYAKAEPDPLRREAPGILRHLDEGHADDLLACVRAHLRSDADWVVPTALDRYGLEVTVLNEDGVIRERLDFQRPVADLDELQHGLRATLRCRCR